MEKICILDAELNKCPHLGKGQICNAPHNQCGMLEKQKEESEPYVRQPRWYEKYYK